MKTIEIRSKQTEWIARISIAIIFFWFGFIKVVGASPANEIVEELLLLTLPFIPFSIFIVFLGIWESTIGILFLFPKFTKIGFWLMLIQMSTTFGPLFLLPEVTWQSLLIPTIEGQYIIKNVALVALSLILYVHYNNKLSLSVNKS